jgi:Uma2 family endonuclease
MPLPVPSQRLSLAQFLEMEQESQAKHEYKAGEVFPMAGASAIHNIISLNLAAILLGHLRGTPCRVFMADVKLKLEQADACYYPDLMVSCEQDAASHYRERPVLVVEVLSASTAKFDSGDKRLDYQTLASLQEYVLVSQDCMDVRVYRRAESGWTASIYTDGAVVPFESVGLQVPIERIYEEAWD